MSSYCIWNTVDHYIVPIAIQLKRKTNQLFLIQISSISIVVVFLSVFLFEIEKIIFIVFQWFFFIVLYLRILRKDSCWLYLQLNRRATNQFIYVNCNSTQCRSTCFRCTVDCWGCLATCRKASSPSRCQTFNLLT